MTDRTCSISHDTHDIDAPLFRLPFQPYVRLRLAVLWRRRLVLRPVKDVHISSDRLGSDEFWVLRHVSSSVDLSVMIDGLLDPDSSS